jgi:hypothetical protein
VPTAADKLAFSRCMRSHGVTNFPDPINGHVGENQRGQAIGATAAWACVHECTLSR